MDYLRHLRGFCLLSAALLACVHPSWAAVVADKSSPAKIVAVLHCDYPPVSFWDKAGEKPSGFFVDIMESITNRTGFQVNYICKSGWSEMIGAIESGEADLGVLLRSEEREKKLLFSVPIDITYLSLFARSGSDVNPALAPAGYTVGIIKGSMAYEQLHNRPDVKLRVVDSYQAGIFSLLAGEIGLFAGEESMILRQAREARLDDRIKRVGKPFIERERGLAVRKDNNRLQAALNESLSGFVGSPEYQRIYLKWYGTPTPYWTGEKILSVSAASLLIVIGVMAFWRYLSLAKINKDLVQQNAERQRAEEALKKSESFVKNILETVDEGFIVIDRDFRILSANKAYLQQVRSTESVIGKKCYEVSHKLETPCYEVGEICAVRHTFATNEPSVAVHVHRDDKGMPVFVETKSYPIRDESGAVQSVIEIVNDITEKKKLEDQLRHAQKMEAVGQLAGGIAHDFNNIITAILGYGSLIKIKMADADPMKHNLQQMLDSAERAANLTRGLLAFSRKQVISPRLVNLNTIVANVEKLLRRVIGEDVELMVRLTENDLTVMADSGQLEQVLMNIAANARDAMTEGGNLEISTRLFDLDYEFIKSHGYGQRSKYALISISDTGHGMDEGTQKKIFEPFFTTKEVGKGTGLGLSIAYGIVKQHNGYITCVSEIGRGTTFRIYLPLAKGELANSSDTANAETPGGTETILVAEDDVVVNNLMREVLTQHGYSVITAADGEEAIAKFSEHGDRIQLLLLDVIMPKKSGKDVLDEVRKSRPAMKAIFTSGYTADIIQKRHIVEEGLNFLEKPIAPVELLRMIRKVMDNA
jgi:PAS domain S-box-containing protein